jgi:hypothetical protein
MKRKYTTQKSNATRRGVEFLLSFEEWCKIWEDSGKYEQRGRGKDNYCMCRFGDIGPYSVDNVYIDTNSNNISEGNKDKMMSPETRTKISESTKGKSHDYAVGDKNVMHRPEVKAKMSVAIGGSNNYRAKTVVGPHGTFGSTHCASKALNIPAETIQYWCREHRKGWSYL